MKAGLSQVLSCARVMLRDRLRDHAGNACVRSELWLIQVNLDELLDTAVDSICSILITMQCILNSIGEKSIL